MVIVFNKVFKLILEDYFKIIAILKLGLQAELKFN